MKDSSTSKLAPWTVLLTCTGACYASDMSVADTNTSWLQTCEQPSDCADGYTCVAGLCEAADGDGAAGASGEPVGAGAAAAGSDSDSAATGTGSATGERVLGLGPEFVLSVPERHSGPPAVRWASEHWVAAWSSSPQQQGGVSGIELVHVSPSGEVGSRRVHQTSAWFAEIVITDDGHVGVLDTHSSCNLELLEPAASAVLARFDVPCGPDSHQAAAAPIPGTGDWLIAYGEGVQGGEFVVGRYRAELDDWVIAPTPIGPRTDNDVLDVFAAGDDAVIAFGGPAQGTSVVTAVGLATAGASSLSGLSTRALSGDVITADGHYALSQVGARTLLFGMDGEALWVAAVDAGAPASPGADVAVVTATGVADRRPGVALIEELGLTAICYGTGPGPGGGFGDHQDGVSCALVDAEGAPVGEPLVVAQAMDNIGGLDLAWSGENLLLVYWDIEMGPDPAASEALRGRILELR